MCLNSMVFQTGSFKIFMINPKVGIDQLMAKMNLPLEKQQMTHPT